MTFNTATGISNIIFQGWTTHSWKDILISAVVICVIATIFEGLKAFKSYLTQRRCKKPLTSKDNDDFSDSILEITSMQAELIMSPSSSSVWQQFRRKKRMLFSLETVLHIVNFFFGYILMFLVMTYSVWFLLAILLGSGAGFFIFRPIRDYLTAKFSPPQKSASHHFSGDGSSHHGGHISINASSTSEDNMGENTMDGKWPSNTESYS